LQTDLKLTAADAVRASPAWLPTPGVQAGRGEVYAVCGGNESAEFLRHNALIRQAWGKTVVPVCEPQPGLNHFSILEALIDLSHRMHRLAQQLLRQS
jgi:arylformamidase